MENMIHTSLGLYVVRHTKYCIATNVISNNSSVRMRNKCHLFELFASMFYLSTVSGGLFYNLRPYIILRTHQDDPHSLYSAVASAPPTDTAVYLTVTHTQWHTHSRATYTDHIRTTTCHAHFPCFYFLLSFFSVCFFSSCVSFICFLSLPRRDSNKATHNIQCQCTTPSICSNLKSGDEQKMRQAYSDAAK